jgi:ABC-type antimicrobial peptide transport system permease subunit
MDGRKAYAQALRELAPGSPKHEPVAFAVQWTGSIASERLLSVLSGFFALLALLLSGIGSWRLMASYVTQRTTEISPRMALGATHVDVFALVIQQVSALLFSGTLIGACRAFYAAHSIQAFLCDVKASGAAIFSAAVLVLTLCGLGAAMVPARRAVSD